MYVNVYALVVIPTYTCLEVKLAERPGDRRAALMTPELRIESQTSGKRFLGTLSAVPLPSSGDPSLQGKDCRG